MCAVRTPAMAAISFASHSVLRRTLHSFVTPRPLVITSNKLSHYTTLISLPLSSSGTCHLPQAIKGDVDSLLGGVRDKGAIEAVKHIIELARRASSRREVLHTDFLTPPILNESIIVLGKLADIKAVAQGGYPQAERCRLSVGHPQAFTTDPDIVAALRTKSFKTVEASLTVDAIASAGFRISRTKLVDLISNGDVRVNWTTVTKSNTTIKNGDIISVSGKGRLKIGEINSTKKGKFAVELIQYL
ncbi:putative RNA-binding protein YlmH [Camellia lanceoleosa]|uniref:RNA-binding protein YlmH n=1 Tax=Camellia lanceoleosa TaxID=1840588 RepID=A0ACC0HFD8_9ERIC|nr:putative RNA-binding protein YlmH [Camellia lanceoleosa]